ncbi:MAG: acetyl-CoA decarbonylase/synthase complex subunit gamma [Spirochaetes bacterium]|nr:MAG: acetyl-CoA decarbonylase/synthase complex subunit gamma [Spirochaetota bacterium]
MALTGLQIQKLLPGTNCRECGSNTCLAFAMKLAAKKAELAACPYASDEAKRVLGEAGEPPVRSVGLGPDGKLVTGGETVLYRHEKTFVNRTIIAVAVPADAPEAEFDRALEAIRAYRFTRVGETFGIDMIALDDRGGDATGFTARAGRAFELCGLPLVLRSDRAEVLAAAAGVLKGSGSVLAPVGPADPRILADAARNAHCALALTAPDLDSLAALAGELREGGINALLLNFSTHSLLEKFQTNSIARRAAIMDNIKSLGLPFISFIDDADLLDGAARAVTGIAKYDGVIVLPSFDPALIAPLMTLRQNVFTDPQKPIQVEPKLYPIGEPGPDSPVFVTTNFSLTYFVVSAEIENSGISAWLLVPECEGMSVLTAWAAGKFGATSIAKFIREEGIEEKIMRRDIIIPGYVAQISGELEEALPGWKVLVGPQEASDLESYVKAHVKA